MSSEKSYMYKSEANNGLRENLEASQLWFANEEWKQSAVTKVESPQLGDVVGQYNEKTYLKHQMICQKCGRKIKPQNESFKRVIVRDNPVYCYEEIIYDHNVIHIVPVIVKKVEKHIYKHEYKIEKQVVHEKQRFEVGKSSKNRREKSKSNQGYLK
ncbi:MAG: hypothetical protein ACRCS6_04265 [Turicibacter sp.]